MKSPHLHHCTCSPGPGNTFGPLAELLPEHTSPELLFLETKWASLVSFGVTAELLKDTLPVDEKLNGVSIRNHVFVESTVNQVTSKRIVKRQQMQWSQRGAHLLLQTRTRVLNDQFEQTFRKWYPQFRVEISKSPPAEIRPPGF